MKIPDIPGWISAEGNRGVGDIRLFFGDFCFFFIFVFNFLGCEDFDCDEINDFVEIIDFVDFLERAERSKRTGEEF